jgi:hypothetical protein
MGLKFEITGNRAVRIQTIDVLRRFAASIDSPIQHAGLDRLLFIHEPDGNFVQGLLLTVKDHRRFCELRRTDQAIRLDVREGEEGANVIDFNFFAMNLTTGRGLYQYYRGSCWINTLGNIAASVCNELAQARIDEEIASQGGHLAIKQRVLADIRRRYRGKLETSILTRTEDFYSLIEKMRSLDGVDFVLTTLAPERQGIAPLSGVARALKQHVYFNKGSTLQERKRAVLNKNPQWFGHFDFDDLAAGMTFEPDRFHASPIAQHLSELAMNEPLVNQASS